MGLRLLCLCLATALLAYSIYTPLPPDFDQPWKVMLLSAAFRATMHMVSGCGAAERCHAYLFCVYGDILSEKLVSEARR